MKNDKFKKLSENEIGKISGGVAHETKGFLGMKSFDNFDANGNYESTTMRPKKGHMVIDNDAYKKAKQEDVIETINEQPEINAVLDAKK